MTYSALERFHDALKGTPQDRVPIFPMIAAWAAFNFSDSPPDQLAREPQRVVDAQIRAMEAVGYDAFFGYADPMYIPQAYGCNVRFLETGQSVRTGAGKIKSSFRSGIKFVSKY
ncbi:MAG: hypothetical protein KAS40_04260 [Desulfobacterales bacterium]|nr:hypothetical protein [Desulfobacterales bacterium]